MSGPSEPQNRAIRPKHPPSDWSPRPIPQPAPERRTADPKTPTLRELAEREGQRASLVAAQAPAWLELEYTHPDDESPMAGAPYRVRLADGSIKDGRLDGQGRARLDGLSPSLAGTPVTVHFGDPAPAYRLLPTAAEPNPDYRGEVALGQVVAPRVELASASHDLSGLTLPRSPFADVPPAVDEALDFVWGVVAGAYKKDPTTGQIVGQILVTLIPVVGQIAVVRDATAFVYRLTRPHLTTAEKVENWIGLVLCLVALVPEIGGALAGVLRLAGRGGRAAEVSAEGAVAVLNRLGRGNAVRWARQHLTYDAIERVAFSQFNALMAKLDAIFAQIVGAPHWMVPEPALAAAGRARADLRALRGEAPGQIRAAVRALVAPVERALQKAEMRAAERDVVEGTTNGSAKATAQAADSPPAGRVADETFSGSRGTGQYWKDPIEVNGRRVYQRDDLFDPHAVDAQGRTNIERMRRGRAPVGYDGEPVNLHHLTQQEPGAMAEVGGRFHAENTRTLHGLTESGRSFRFSPDGGVTEAARGYERYRQAYWKLRARGL